MLDIYFPCILKGTGCTNALLVLKSLAKHRHPSFDGYVITSDLDIPGQSVTARISIFGESLPQERAAEF